VSDLLERLDAAIGGPDRRTKDGRRTRKMTPLKVETQLLLDAKAEIERLRAVANRGGHLAVANAEIERLRSLCDSLADDVERLTSRLRGDDA
jgi:hypothetical protein